MPDDLTALYRQAAQATAKGSKSFYFATRFFPKELARAAHGVYWFCRHTDDIVDQCYDVEQGRRELDEWSANLTCALATGASSHPVLAVFVATVNRYRIPHEYAFELVEGMRMDLNGTRYRTFGELRQFCYRVASVVGLMMSHVIGFRDDALAYAVDLGIAMQLTNILRDVGEDLERGRIYLPAEEMARFGYSEVHLRAHVRNDAFRELMRFQVARARDHYNRAMPGIKLLDSRGRFAVQMAAEVYCAILQRIEHSDFDVFETRAVVPAAQKYWIMMRALAGRAEMRRIVSDGSRATLAGLAGNYLSFYVAGTPLWTDTIAQWIMARTPNHYSLWLLGNLGGWAKPFAMTGGLAVLGFAATLVAAVRSRKLTPIAASVIALLSGALFDYTSVAGQFSFWLPALLVLLVLNRPVIVLRPARREALVMLAGTVVVAAESFGREQRTAVRATLPVDLEPFQPPPETFASGLVRKAITPAAEFYGMSKNTVDPSVDTRTWRLKIRVDGRLVRQLSYKDLLAMPRVSLYSTLRCISNTLGSDLMGTGYWTGVRLATLIDRVTLPSDIHEVAIIGIDGHGDSLPLEFGFGDGALLAIGMNGRTLSRTQGFPLRLVAPRYYGFKNVKWIDEISFTKTPYIGTWPRMGYTKEPVVHTGSHIDRIHREGSRLLVGGVAFAGDRGIRAVELRADGGPWVSATLEAPLSRWTWTRWTAALAGTGARQIQARAMDGAGRWQAEVETPLFPDGVQGPTMRSAS